MPPLTDEQRKTVERLLYEAHARLEGWMRCANDPKEDVRKLCREAIEVERENTAALTALLARVDELEELFNATASDMSELCDGLNAVLDKRGGYNEEGDDTYAANFERLLSEREQERNELLESSFCNIAYECKGGWWSSQGSRTAIHFADRLVELGLWEKDETRGTGRVQFYRPKESK